MDYKIGNIFETVFWPNRKEETKFKFRATHADGKRAPKVILSNDDKIQPGQPCRVKVVNIDKPDKEGHGYIEANFVSSVVLMLDDSIYIDQMVMKKLQALLESGVNILFDGPQGSGKTVLSKKIAGALNLEYVYFNCSTVFEATDFVASLQIKAGEKGTPETIWMTTDILRAIDAANSDPSRRFLIFLDEINRCRELARNGIMPALDATRKLFNPLTGGYVDIPDNIQWIAAINTGADFTGTTPIDPAQLDRFAPLKISYPPEEEEIRILSRKHPSVPVKLISRVVKIANKIRNDRNLTTGLSVRATDEVLTLLSHPNFAEEGEKIIPELLKTSFCGRFKGMWNDDATDAGIVWEHIKKEFFSNILENIKKNTITPQVASRKNVLDCGDDKDKFVDAANKGVPAFLSMNDEGAIFECEVDDKFIFHKKLVKIDDKEPNEMKILLNGKSLKSKYEKGKFNRNLLDTLTIDIDDCEGDLKDALAELREAL